MPCPPPASQLCYFSPLAAPALPRPAAPVACCVQGGDAFQGRGVYSRDMVRGNSRRGGGMRVLCLACESRWHQEREKEKSAEGGRRADGAARGHRCSPRGTRSCSRRRASRTSACGMRGRARSCCACRSRASTATLSASRATGARSCPGGRTERSGRLGRRFDRTPPPSLVLSGHAASLTPY